MKTRSFIAIASFFIVTSLLYCSYAVMADSSAAFASKRVKTVMQFPGSATQSGPWQHSEQHPAPQRPTPTVQQPTVQHLEHKQPERTRREELSKKLELRREEIKAEKKEKIKKQQAASQAQDSE